VTTNNYRLVRHFGTDTHPWTLVLYIWEHGKLTMQALRRYSNRDFRKGCEDAQSLREGLSHAG